MSSKEQEMFDLFLSEANEHLETIETELLVLEKEPRGNKKDRIDNLFRAIHSIKGSSGFMQLDKINELSHAMETLLQKMRNGEITPEGEFIDSLLSGVDLLTKMIKNVEESEQVDIDSVKDTLIQLTQKNQSKKSVQKVKKKINKTTAPQKKNTDVMCERVVLPKKQLDYLNQKFGFLITETTIQRLSPGHELYILIFNLYENDKLPSYLATKLHKLGIIIDANISTEAEIMIQDLQSVPLIYNVLYSSILEKEMILLSLNLSEGNVIQITKNKQDHVDDNSDSMNINTPIQEDDYIDLSQGDEIISRVKSEPEKEFDKTENDKAEAKHNTTDLSLSGDINNNGSLPTLTEEDVIELKLINKTGVQEQNKSSVNNIPRLMGGHTETIRVDVQILDQLMTLVGELVLVRNRQLVSIDHVDALSVEDLDLVTSELQETIMRTRMQPIGSLLGKLPRIVRDLSKKLNKKIDIITFGNDVELDKSILETLSDPLTHLIRNSCDHGIEKPDERIQKGKSDKGTITIQAYHEAGQINIVITDDGAGIDPEKIKDTLIQKGLKKESELSDLSDKEILSLIMIPGFSTADRVSNVSGRGVGMDVVKTSIEQFGGTLELNSSLNEGTTIHLRLPLTLAIIPSLIVEIENMRYAIPQINLEELVSLYDNDITTKIETASNREVYRLRGKLLPLI